MSIKKILREWTLHDDLDQVKEDLRMKGIAIGEEITDYIDSGGYGDVYEIKDRDKVLKIHEQEYENDVIDKIMDSGKDFDHVCTYYFNKYIEPFYLVVMERLYKTAFVIPREGGLILYTLSESFHKNHIADALYKSNVEERARKNIPEEIKQLEKIYDGDLFYYIIDAYLTIEREHRFQRKDSKKSVVFAIDHPKLIKDAYQGVVELASIGIHNEDLHGQNIMLDKKTNNYKIIDIMA